jgi:hypothetical protein
MHGYSLKVTSVRQDDIGMEFEPSFAKTAKDAHNILSIKELVHRHVS